MGVNTRSGTEATGQSFSESGVSGSASGNGCASNVDSNAASDPNLATATGDNAGQHIALENNASQMGGLCQRRLGLPIRETQPLRSPRRSTTSRTGCYLLPNPERTGSAVINGTQFAASKLTENGKGVRRPHPSC